MIRIYNHVCERNTRSYTLLCPNFQNSRLMLSEQWQNTYGCIGSSDTQLIEILKILPMWHSQVNFYLIATEPPVVPWKALWKSSSTRPQRLFEGSGSCHRPSGNYLTMRAKYSAGHPEEVSELFDQFLPPQPSDQMICNHAATSCSLRSVAAAIHVTVAGEYPLVEAFLLCLSQRKAWQWYS